jgi:hypothetical protein
LKVYEQGLPNLIVELAPQEAALLRRALGASILFSKSDNFFDELFAGIPTIYAETCDVDVCLDMGSGLLVTNLSPSERTKRA